MHGDAALDVYRRRCKAACRHLTDRSSALWNIRGCAQQRCVLCNRVGSEPGNDQARGRKPAVGSVVFCEAVCGCGPVRIPFSPLSAGPRRTARGGVSDARGAFVFGDMLYCIIALVRGNSTAGFSTFAIHFKKSGFSEVKRLKRYFGYAQCTKRSKTRIFSVFFILKEGKIWL